jgi:hypothetical protein
LHAWSEHAGLYYGTIYARYKRGVRGEALIAPARERRAW